MGYPTDLDINLDPHIEFTGFQIQIVSAYSRRDPTNTEDRLIALAGIVARMQASEPGNSRERHNRSWLLRITASMLSLILTFRMR